MNVEQLISKLEIIADAQPNINTIVRYSPSYLESMPDCKFSVFSWVLDRVRTDEQYAYVQLNLFYVDRQTDDGENKLNVQSTGMAVLQNILNTFIEENEEAEIEGEVEYVPFSQKYRQMCAGVYAAVEISIPLELFCAEYYD